MDLTGSNLLAGVHDEEQKASLDSAPHFSQYQTGCSAWFYCVKVHQHNTKAEYITITSIDLQLMHSIFLLFHLNSVQTISTVLLVHPIPTLNTTKYISHRAVARILIAQAKVCFGTPVFKYPSQAYPGLIGTLSPTLCT